jgi:hypothetical protein
MFSSIRLLPLIVAPRGARGNYLMGLPMMVGGKPSVAEGMAGDSLSPAGLATVFLSRRNLRPGLQKRLPATFNLRLNIAYILRIIQHEIGKPPFFLHGLLGCLTAVEFFRFPAPF